MNIQLVGSTNNLTNQEDAKRFIQNHARVCYSEGKWDSLLEENFNPKLIDSLIQRGHHSPFDHFQLNLNFEGLEKILAMIFNNQGVYTTSEKSARYTKMSGMPKHQLELYNKWDNWFNKEISRRFNNDEFSRLYKRGKDGKTLAEKLSQENARYMSSIFTPTNMTYTISWRQLNILYHGFKEFIEKNSNKDNLFYKKILNSMQSFLNNEEIRKWIIEDSPMKMKGNIPLRFIREKPVEKNFGKEIYSSNYFASFASFAQLQRHRLAVYEIFGGFEQGSTFGFYIPRLVNISGKSSEWMADLNDISQYDIPQAKIVGISERGMREHLPAKSIERECGLAQLETARVHNSFLKEYSKYVPEMKKYLAPACEIEGSCKKGGCVFGPKNYLDRLI